MRRRPLPELTLLLLVLAGAWTTEAAPVAEDNPKPPSAIPS